MRLHEERPGQAQLYSLRHLLPLLRRPDIHRPTYFLSQLEPVDLNSGALMLLIGLLVLGLLMLKNRRKAPESKLE